MSVVPKDILCGEVFRELFCLIKLKKIFSVSRCLLVRENLEVREKSGKKILVREKLKSQGKVREFKIWSGKTCNFVRKR